MAQQPLVGEGAMADSNCPEVLSQTVPQPSPGVDYRRRSSLGRRATVGPGRSAILLYHNPLPCPVSA